MKIDPDYRFRRSEQILYKQLSDGPVLIDPYRRVLIRLDEVAVEIWNLVDGQNSVNDIVNQLEKEFDVDRQELEYDISDFMKGLVKREIVY